MWTLYGTRNFPFAMDLEEVSGVRMRERKKLSLKYQHQ